MIVIHKVETNLNSVPPLTPAAAVTSGKVQKVKFHQRTMLAFKRGRECNGCLVVNGIWRSWGIYVWCWTMMMMWSYYGDMMLEPTTNGFVGSDPWTFTFKTLAILSQCMVSMQFHFSELKLTRQSFVKIFFEHSGTDVILSRLMSSRFNSFRSLPVSSYRSVQMEKNSILCHLTKIETQN